MGKPDLSSLPYVIEQNSLNFLNSLPERESVKWRELYSTADPNAIELISHMILYNPNDRFTTLQCLSSNYLTSLDQGVGNENTCDRIFDWAFDNIELTREGLTQALYNEAY